MLSIMDYFTVIVIFGAVCSILGRWGLSRDRGVWTILAISAVVNMGYAPYVTDGNWLIFLAACCEFLTIGALSLFAWNKLGRRQSFILGLLWIAHCGLYLDVNLGTCVIYDHYETVTQCLIGAQLALGTNGIHQLFKRASLRVRSFGRIRRDGMGAHKSLP